MMNMDFREIRGDGVGEVQGLETEYVSYTLLYRLT